MMLHVIYVKQCVYFNDGWAEELYKQAQFSWHNLRPVSMVSTTSEA